MSYLTQAHRRWWQPLLEILLVIIFWTLFIIVALIGVELVAESAGHDGFLDQAFSEPIDMFQFESSLVTMLILAVGAPAVLLVARLVRKQDWKSVLGADRSFDWRLFLLGTSVGLPISLLFVCAIYLVGQPRSVTLSSALMWVCVLLVPVQSMAEELIFRGVLAQAAGFWTKSWVAAVVVPVPLFVIGHEYSLCGLLAIAWFALCAGYLAHRTGGLAAPMAFHVANNLGFFSFGAIGLGDLNNVQVSAVEALIDVMYCTVATAALIYLHQSMKRTEAIHGVQSELVGAS